MCTNKNILAYRSYTSITRSITPQGVPVHILPKKSTTPRHQVVHFATAIREPDVDFSLEGESARSGTHSRK